MNDYLSENQEEEILQRSLLQMAAVHDEDPLNYLIDPEGGCSDPGMKESIQRLRILVSILKHFLEFLLQFQFRWEWNITVQNPYQEFHDCSKHIVDVVQKIGLLGTDAEPVQVASHLESLKSLKEDIVRIVSLRPSFPDHIYVRRFEVVNLMQFIENLSQNMKYIDVICKAHINFRVKNELLGLEQRLKILATFLTITEPSLLFYNVKSVVRSAQVLAAEISCYLFLSLVDDEVNELVAAGDHMKEDSLPDLIMKISTLLRELRDLHKEQGPNSIRLADDHSPAMNEHLMGFLDYLMHKLRELSDNTASSMVTVKIQIDILIDELSFIRSSLVDILLRYSILAVLTEALIIDAGFFIYYSLDKEGDEELVKYSSSGLLGLLDAVHAIHQQARDIFHKKLCSPRHSKRLGMDELEFVAFLIKKLQGLPDSEAASIYPLKSQIRMVHEEMVTLRKCIIEMAESLGESQKEFLLIQLKHATDQTECVIDSLMAGEGSPLSLWLQKLGIFVIRKDIKTLQKEVKTVLKMNWDSDVRGISKASICASAQINEPPPVNAPTCSKDQMQIKIDEGANKLVGLKDAIEEIIGLLTEGSRQLKILSIVGMPGIGKTTLANSVYKHPSVDINFHVHAWCCLSRVYQKETLLSNILGQISPEKNNQSHEISGECFGEILYKSLKGKKYLIVIDDIWDIDAWLDLRECFPDDENGSRILFTTRIHTVATQASRSLPYVLRLLSSEESCELLRLKLFNGETCPEELASISKCIASSCKGLPLAVVLVAGILRRTERTIDSWKQVAKTLIRSCNTEEKIFKVLEVSYKHLPDYLKPCFSYFGTLPKGTAIEVSKLIRLWISEGFVQQLNQGQQSLKKQAEIYLNDLIDRSLVMVARKSSKGGAKLCQVHNVLREFCSIKLEKKLSVMRKDLSFGTAILYSDHKMHRLNILRIFSTIKVPHICSLLYYNKFDTDMDSRRKNPSEQVELNALDSHRKNSLSEQPFRDLLSVPRYNLSEQAAMSSNRLSVFATRSSQRRELHYGSILKHTNLRVLDLENLQLQSSANTSDLVKISKLIHLKYLAIRIRTTEIPTEISNLQNLETFLLSGAIGEVKLPEAIWNMVNLKEVIMHHCFFSFEHYSQEFLDNSFQLDSFKSISTLCIRLGNVEKFMRRLPSVEKLGCIFVISWHDYYEASNCFKILEFLSALQSLKMSFQTMAPYPFQFCFPSNLKKLTMSNSHLPWDEISVIGKLPSLEVLKLLNNAFEGQQWDMRESEFQKLKFLKLESLDLQLWNASSEHLPCLEQLVLLSCTQLEEIPSSFGEIPTLQLIEMKWCSSSAMDSVKEILEDQRNYCNDQLNIIVVGRQAELP